MCACWLQDGQLVTFSEVGGMTELNNHKPIRIKNCKVIPRVVREQQQGDQGQQQQ